MALQCDDGGRLSPSSFGSHLVLPEVLFSELLEVRMMSTVNFSTGLLVLYFLKFMCLCLGEAAMVSE